MALAIAGDGSGELPGVETAEEETCEESAAGGAGGAAKGAPAVVTCAGGSGQAEADLALGSSAEAQTSVSVRQRRVASAGVTAEELMSAAGLRHTAASARVHDVAEGAGMCIAAAVAAACYVGRLGASTGSGVGRCAVVACRRIRWAAAVPGGRLVAAYQVLFGSHFGKTVWSPSAAGEYGLEEGTGHR